MERMRASGKLLARFVLCFALIACFWIVSISYRVGPFNFTGSWADAANSGAFTDSDGVFLAAALALLVGLFGLYRSGRVSAVLIVIVSLVVITFIDAGWASFGAVDDYKAVPGYVLKPAIAAVLICPFALLFPAKRDGDDRQLLLCWAALAVTVCLLGSNAGHHLLGLQSMIGPSYMLMVFLCLLVPELLRQAWRLRRALSLQD